MFTVTVTNEGNKFWLRGTTWAFSADRANTFGTWDEAMHALQKASPFMKKAMFKKAVIEESVAA